MRYRVEFVELYQPWEISPRINRGLYVVDLPPDLVERFEKAKAEMDEVWSLLRTEMREVFE